MNGSAYLPGQEVAVFSNSRKGWIAAHVTAVHRDGSVTCKYHGLPKQKDIPLAMQTPNSIMLVQDSSVTPGVCLSLCVCVCVCVCVFVWRATYRLRCVTGVLCP